MEVGRRRYAFIALEKGVETTDGWCVCCVRRQQVTLTRLGIGTTLALLVGLLAFGAFGSGAWFTDQELVPAEAQAATLDIQVKNLADDSVADSEEGTAATTHVMTGMVPGVFSSVHDLDIEVKNLGDFPVKLRIDDGRTSGSTNIYNNLTVWAAQPDSCVSPTSWTVRYGGPLSGLSELWPVTLAPNGTTCVHFEFRLESTATDSGGETAFDISVTAGQTTDPAFTP
jgi:hypothetical protein